MKYEIIILLFLSITFFNAQSQEPIIRCGFDEMLERQKDEDPLFFKKINKFEKEWVRHNEHRPDTVVSPVVLPVVFHIFHLDGPENLSDERIERSLSMLNASFSNTGSYDRGVGVNTDIQFCLAKRDPQGNKTSGITRNYSLFTSFTDKRGELAMDSFHWDTRKYINVYVVKEVRLARGKVGGFATLPFYHGNARDGIVVTSRHLGEYEASNALLTHEMGHYLGLYHTFSGGCKNDNCLKDGDKICDTPPDGTKSYTACSDSINSCTTDEDDTSINNPFRPIRLGGLGDQHDMIDNYMDYNILCDYQFTKGQKERMHFSIQYARSSLLQSESCKKPCPIVDVGNDTTICYGDSIKLIPNNSYAKYHWSPEEKFDCSTCPEVSFVPDSNTTVVVNVELRENCSSSDTILIKTNKPISGSDSISLCEGGIIYYRGQAITDTGMYQVPSMNCDTMINLQVTLSKAPLKNIDLGPDVASCSDTTLILEPPSNFASYQWSNNLSDPSLTITEEGEYWLIAKDECGRTYKDTFRLFYNNVPPVSLGSDTTVCPEKAFHLRGDPGYIKYNWFPENAIECNNCQYAYINLDSTLTVTLSAVTEYGCVSRDTLTIEVKNESVVYKTLSFCEGETFSFKDSLIDKPGDYVFHFGEYCDTTLYLRLQELTFSTLSTDDFALSFLHDLQDLSGQAYDINLNLRPWMWDIEWTPSEYFSCDSCVSTSILPFKGKKTLGIKLTHLMGCEFDEKFEVNWKDDDFIYIPNIFTPNDDGTNDTWVVTPTPLVNVIKDLRIYTVWGQLIREWKNVEGASWDGRLKGRMLSPGVFVYQIEFLTITGDTYRREGDFTLVR